MVYHIHKVYTHIESYALNVRREYGKIQFGFH